MNTTDEEIITKATKWAKKNKEKVAIKTIFKRPVKVAKECILMAGSPGAGKTETVRNLQLDKTFTILEADAIREMNPYYKRTEGGQKGNAHLIQKAASIGLNHCRKVCIEKEIAFVQDTTLQNHGSRDLIKKLLKAGWVVKIFFIFQNPKDAWKFTKAREAEEGRNIPKESFAESFTNILKNLEYIQEKHPKIVIKLAIKKGGKTKEVKMVDKSIIHTLKESNIDIPSKNAILKLIENESVSNHKNTP